jgi:hypothetical protein
VKQESLFYWEKCPSKNSEFVISSSAWHDDWTGEWEDCHRLREQENYSAYTVAELGEMLPKEIATKSGERIFLSSSKEDEFWVVEYNRTEGNEKHHEFGDTEAEARAKMLIYLLENNLISNS